MIGNLTYEYDAAGRRAKIGGSFARTGLPQPLSTATYNAANQLTQRGSVTITYDSNGNLTGDGSNVYTWNVRNKLVSISGSVNASFQYDSFGRRVSATTNGTSLGYLHDGKNVVQQLSGTTPVANLVNGKVDELFTRTDAAGTRCLLSSHLRSALGLTDDNGALLTQYTYEPFGQTTVTGTASTNSFQYTGRENDETGLYFYRARYYSPLLQRFISEDPIGFRGGDTNLYAYVKNDPLNSFDPLGLQEQGSQDGQRRPVPPREPSEIAAHEVVNGVVELANPLLPLAGGVAGVAPGVLYIVEDKNRQLQDVEDLCCTTKHCECNNPHDPNGDPPGPGDPNPLDPNNPQSPGDSGRPGSPGSPRKKSS